MFRTVLRAVKLLMSLASVLVLLTTRTPTGGPSLLERIPTLMDALEARVAAKAAGPTATVRDPVMPPGEWPPEPTSPQTAMPPLPSEDPSSTASLTRSLPRLPSGNDRIKVNRGLP